MLTISLIVVTALLGALTSIVVSRARAEKAAARAAALAHAHTAIDATQALEALANGDYLRVSQVRAWRGRIGEPCDLLLTPTQRALTGR